MCRTFSFRHGTVGCHPPYRAKELKALTRGVETGRQMPGTVQLRPADLRVVNACGMSTHPGESAKVMAARTARAVGRVSHEDVSEHRLAKAGLGLEPAYELHLGMMNIRLAPEHVSGEAHVPGEQLDKVLGRPRQ